MTPHDLLSEELLIFLHKLNKQFEPYLRDVLSKRRKGNLSSSELKRRQFINQADIENTMWTCGNTPHDLQDRRVEITGPTDPKMVINALNSGAKIFMADFEDATSPTLSNIIEGQITLYKAVRKNLDFKDPNSGKEYKLNDKTATLVVRPRGLHLQEDHYGIPASIFDFGVFLFHNAHELVSQGSGPYFYLPKLESANEAIWWNDLFVFAQDYLKLPLGTIKVTVLIETIYAAFEMEPIVFALKDHIVGLNAGRWDYIFSIIKKYGELPNYIMPDRSQIVMTVPFMEAYCKKIVETCHKRDIHAIGGMSAFIPNRKEPDVTENALKKVTEDKKREANMGFDGTWVAHPDLVPVAQAEFDKVLKNLHQKDFRIRINGKITDAQLLDVHIPGSTITESGVRTNISVCLRYLEKWFDGIGAVAIDNLMEDAATAEISRSQLWQWLYHKVEIEGKEFTDKEFTDMLNREVETLGISLNTACFFESLILNSAEFEEFLTIPAYKRLLEQRLDLKGDLK